ncbi:GNAT family N-acetyltransferase [Paenibacillus montanisoli]|uniref:Uncharacterized protein n=1 Tax=Paenibacillus montanisoli TaxID=2081970 RepID=A0A328UDB3_9BACL|nr:GNAT family N-acetyltransferase [Paenibacillus montanisoli]RAP78046.1 hypothetical protein DL346_06275 [Paenibacillus montanisoli]
MTEDCIHTQLKLLTSEDCFVHRIVPASQGDTVILYSPRGGLDIHARIVFESGMATKRHVNDLHMYISPLEGGQAWRLQYIRILGDKINRGYGTIMMEQLLERAIQERIRFIDGRMQQAEHREHCARLRHFYTKFGFSIDEQYNLLWVNTMLQENRHEISKKGLA